MFNFTNDHLSSREGNYSAVRILTKQHHGLNVCHINAQSLYCKIDEFRYLFEDSGVDAVCISETWFTDAHNDRLVELRGYKLFRCDRRGKGGGVAIYIKSDIACRLLRTYTGVNDVEYILIELSSHREKLLLGCVYRPNNRISYDSIISELEQLSVAYDNIIISGDFNANLLSNLSKNFCAAITLLNSTIPTHFTATNASLLDLFLVSDMYKVNHYSQLSAPVFSRHDLLFLSYNFKKLHQKESFSYRDYKNIDMMSLENDLMTASWDEIFYMPSVDDQIGHLNDLIRRLFNKHVSLKTSKLNRRVNAWFSSDIKLLIERRDRLYNRWKRYKTPEFLTDFHRARKDAVTRIRREKLIYFGNKFQNAVSTKQTWRQIKEMGVVNTRHQPVTLDVNALNKEFSNFPQPPVNPDFYEDGRVIPVINEFHFQHLRISDIIEGFIKIKSNAVGLDDIHPRFVKLILPYIIRHIGHIFNTILTTSTFPLKWKSAKIVPVPKSDGNYRPISILPYMSKVFERILHKQIYEHILDNNLLTDCQSGFRPQQSCTTALTEVVENIRCNLDDNKLTFLVLLDYSKAFDTVDHQMLLWKLTNMFHFSTTAAKLMESYLTSRSQMIANDGIFSLPLFTHRGVPQGSILGPLFYTLYANDLPLQIRYSSIQMYADDVQLYLSCSKTCINSAIAKINFDLYKIYQWAVANGLRLNPDKSKCLVIGTLPAVVKESLNICINGSKIQIVNTAKNLGVIFNSALTWSDHINKVCGQIYGKMRTLWQSQHFTPVRIRMMLAKTYLMPTLLYASEIFAGCNATLKRKLNITFNNIVRYIFALKRYDHISPYSKLVLGVHFDDYMKVKNLTFLHRIITTRKPDYLYGRLVFTSSSRNNNIITFRYRKSASYHQFYIYTISLWNHLPSNIQFTSNAVKFKGLLMNYYNNS